ncbi:flagellar motor switch phosphatase FliY [Thermoanaerobacter brockii subsp. lactiethylicus]|uniref:flagellar motor switch phosphatase FliY n=1 Tax=Thermoanaerobacter sp. (strain X514) TaxID=399726 RepID=UPI0000E1DF90|nr:flagellar motor switch phosphatase FliY [Thermoanaerobacter sp. X514]ABY92966.1 CheC, inhibitor of MCP methylation [Thermoanaerobacter sp. X514]MBZ4656837.1 CheC, inhibitor of methylation / FliN fusion protein [Thermoanaerobacter sp.]MDI3500297.1 flagellar motor switch protein FliN [Thermoanaerobacter sp.]MDI3529230.1 flagellar motor switch protein FliN [Thermoanaerobacter sp.]
MNDFLSQEEINALLKGLTEESKENQSQSGKELTEEEQDILGEIGNISFGTSATTLYTLLRNKVTITTPKVSVLSWEELKKEFNIPYVGVEVEYTEGLKGHNLLILKKEDVLKMTDLMMGGEGKIEEGEITELHLSAIGEAMNQMIGSAATSLSTLLNKTINISPPKAFIVDFTASMPTDISFPEGDVVKIAFKMEVGEIIDSEIMQLLPFDFAKELVHSVLSKNEEKSPQATSQEESSSAIIESDEKNVETGSNISTRDKVTKKKQKVNVSPVVFQSFDEEPTSKSKEDKENLELILDVPLTITVELGKTKKLIKDILELSEGSIIELDKLAGEPVDILANGKYIAKGEVVVIDENFGVRITDIVHQSKRISNIE